MRWWLLILLVASLTVTALAADAPPASDKILRDLRFEVVRLRQEVQQLDRELINLRRHLGRLKVR